MKITPVAALAAVLASALCTALASTPVLAADYPDHPIKMVVAYPPGGATDTVARAVAQKLGDRLKQSVVVDNRPGASGQIGTDFVAKSPGDGYTIIFTAADTHSINPHVYPRIAYDAKKDFVPVAQVGYLPIALIVNPSVKANNVKEFVALAKANPGKMTFASFGVGSSSHVAMEMLKGEAKLELLHVPFQGAAPALTAVMGGQVDAMMVPLTVAEPNAKAGKVRMLGVAAPKRSVSSPDIPTFAEQGIPLESAPWIGILAPAKTPPAVIELLNREITAAVDDPGMQEVLLKNGVVRQTRSTADLKAFLDGEYDRWGKTVREAKIVAE